LLSGTEDKARQKLDQLEHEISLKSDALATQMSCLRESVRLQHQQIQAAVEAPSREKRAREFNDELSVANMQRRVREDEMSCQQIMARIESLRGAREVVSTERTNLGVVSDSEQIVHSISDIRRKMSMKPENVRKRAEVTAERFHAIRGDQEDVTDEVSELHLAMTSPEPVASATSLTDSQATDDVRAMFDEAERRHFDLQSLAVPSSSSSSSKPVAAAAVAEPKPQAAQLISVLLGR
jgi:hypothetical protein